MYAINVCKSKTKQQKKEKRLLNYFTYGKYADDTEEELEETTKGRKSKLKVKRREKNKQSFRRGSRRGSIADFKHMYAAHTGRRSSNADSIDTFTRSKEIHPSSKIVTHESDSSAKNSERSQDLRHKIGDENFSKSINANKEVVQELDDEDNVSESLSQK